MLVAQNARALRSPTAGSVLQRGRNRFERTGRDLLACDDVRRLYLGGPGLTIRLAH
jgi:hypothetical protein